MRKFFLTTTVLIGLLAPINVDAKWSTTVVDSSVMEFIENSNDLVYDIKYEPVAKRREQLCLALNIYHEARSSSYLDKISTAFTVLTRLHKNFWGVNTACEVVWMQGWDKKKKAWVPHYSWTKDGASDIPKEYKAWINSQIIAHKVFYHKLYGVKNPIPNMTHYVKKEKFNTTYWTKRAIRKKLVGAHIYMELKR